MDSEKFANINLAMKKITAWIKRVMINCWKIYEELKTKELQRLYRLQTSIKIKKWISWTLWWPLSIWVKSCLSNTVREHLKYSSTTISSRWISRSLLKKCACKIWRSHLWKESFRRSTKTKTSRSPLMNL